MALTSRIVGRPSDIPRALTVTTARVHRRLSEEPPPLPRRLNTLGTWWLGLADPRGLLISQGEGKATTPLPIDEAVRYIGSRWLGKTTGHILEALVGRHR